MHNGIVYKTRYDDPGKTNETNYFHSKKSEGKPEGKHSRKTSYYSKEKFQI